jgi:hypothetical protein
MMKNAKKTPNYINKKFICEVCSFGCNKKSDFIRHNSTYKHINATDATSDANKKTPVEFLCEFCGKSFKHKSSLFRHKKICKNNDGQLAKLAKKLAKISHSKFQCECGKSYKHASSLSKHKSKCNYLQNEEVEIEESVDIVPTNNVEILLKALLEKNNDILEENKILREKISTMEFGNTYHNNQTNNNQFNINMFLNEKCKNAMNLEDFVKKIKLSMEDLQFTKDNGYVQGISNIFIKNLNDMDVTERPIHCSDQKRLQFYVKNDDAWSKDKNNEKIDNTIEKISKKQLQTIKDWIKENPNYLDSEAKTDEYFTLVKNITQPNNEKNLKTIKKKVGENVKLEKSDNVKKV